MAESESIDRHQMMGGYALLQEGLRLLAMKNPSIR